ncbi:ACT domain-containing protein [Vibrio sinaloensis]
MVSGITDLKQRLKSMCPKLTQNEFMFCTISS